MLLVLGLGSCFDFTHCLLLARPRTCRMSPVKHGTKLQLLKYILLALSLAETQIAIFECIWLLKWYQNTLTLCLGSHISKITYLLSLFPTDTKAERGEPLCSSRQQLNFCCTGGVLFLTLVGLPFILRLHTGHRKEEAVLEWIAEEWAVGRPLPAMLWPAWVPAFSRHARVQWAWVWHHREVAVVCTSKVTTWL